MPSFPAPRLAKLKARFSAADGITAWFSLDLFVVMGTPPISWNIVLKRNGRIHFQLELQSLAAAVQSPAELVVLVSSLVQSPLHFQPRSLTLAWKPRMV